MRILVVTHYFPPEIGAPQARLSELARTWAADGDDVTVLTGLPNHPTGVVPPAYRGVRRRVEAGEGYRVIRTWLYATPNEGIVKKTLGHLSFMASSVVLGLPAVDDDTDVVVVSSPTFFAILSAWVIARRRHARFVVEIRDLWPAIFVELGVLTNPLVIKALETLELAAYAAADAVVVVSEGFRDDLVRRGVPATKIHTIRNGVDLERFSPAPGDPAAVDAARASLGAGPDEVLVLYIGAHGISHGLTAIADAAAQLGDAPIHVAFVGEGAAKAELAARVRSIEAAGGPTITLRPGVPRDEVAGLLQAADICLVPLRDVPLFATFIPSKIFEYFGAGKAVVGAVRGEPAQILREGGAVVVEPEDVDAIAAAVRDLAADPERRTAMGRTGRAYVEAHFDRRALARTYRSILHDVTHPTGATGRSGGADPSAPARALVAHVWRHPAVRAEPWGPVRAVARLGAWQVWQRATHRPRTVSLPGGLQLRCHPHESAATAVLYTRLPEWKEMRLLLDLLRPGDTFVDVGANAGVYSLLAASVPGTELWAYEPSSDARARLHENVRRNELQDRVRIRPVAAGARTGTGRLTVGLDCTNHLLDGDGGAGDRGAAAEVVEVVRLDDDLRPHLPVALVKIDVEGAEAAVLDGAVGLLARDRPPLILEANDPAALAARLEPLGYAPYWYDPDVRSFVPTVWDASARAPERNVVALHDVAAAEARVRPARTSTGARP